jgi:hypothetical protein
MADKPIDAAVYALDVALHSDQKRQLVVPVIKAMIGAMSHEDMKPLMAAAYSWHPIDPALPMNAIATWKPEAFRAVLLALMTGEDQKEENDEDR